jgi:hypothetical protein
MNKTIFLLLVTLLTSYGISRIQAYEPYHAKVAVNAQSATVSAPNLVDLSRELKGSSIKALIPSYTPTSELLVDINLRGIDTIGFFAANSTVLVVAIPQANIIEVFDGGTRDASFVLYKDYIRDAGARRLLLRAYAKYSPIDPIAGNPNSLMAQMAQADYLLGRLTPLSGCDCSCAPQPITHLFQAGVNGERAFSYPFDTTSVTIPLRYSYSPARTWAVILDAPLTYNRNGGGSSFYGSLGFAARFPFRNFWAVMPTARIGFGGTLDLCTSGTFLSAGVESILQSKIKNFVVSITNYAGYYTSTNFWLTGINFNYRLYNWILKNGLSINTCQGVSLCGRTFNLGLSFIDSYFATDKLYINHYDEVGITLITTGINRRLKYDCLTMGFSYQFGQKSYKGFSLNFAYQF